MTTPHDEVGPRSDQTLSVVHMLNLSFLVAMREALRADPAQASYEYGIDVATAELLRQATDDGLRSLSHSLDRSLFILRVRGKELAGLLQKPTHLRGVLFAVRDDGPSPRPYDA